MRFHLVPFDDTAFGALLVVFTFSRMAARTWTEALTAVETRIREGAENFQVQSIDFPDGTRQTFSSFEELRAVWSFIRSRAADESAGLLAGESAYGPIRFVRGPKCL